MSSVQKHRSFVGPPDRYDLMSAVQFNLMTFLGLRESNTLLDIGCGSLRSGRLFITYLNRGNYHGVEPEKWLVKEGIKNELGKDMIRLKKPKFLYDRNWSFEKFGVSFDYVIAQSIFSHASRFQIETCLRNVEACIRNDSVFAATFVIGQADYEGGEWVYPKKVAFTRKSISNMIVDAGLVGECINWPHPSQTWFVMAKPDSALQLAMRRNEINAMFPLDGRAEGET